MSNREQSRMFQGKLSGFANKDEKAFFTRMLRNYVKGHLIFNYGFDKKGEPIPYVVPQKLGTYEELKLLKNKTE